jgi:hypothetical protein
MGLILKRFQRLTQFILLSLIVLTTYNNCSNPMQSSKGNSANNSSSQLSQQAAFKCTDRTLSSPTKNYILSKAQYTNTIEDLFGIGALSSASAALSTISDDSNGADSHERTSTISSTQAMAYYDSAEAIASYVIASTTRVTTVFGACANTTTPAPTCIDSYLNGYARRILRRPLTTQEITFAKLVMSTAGLYKENLKALLTYHLSSPAFLWTLELGGTSTNGTKVFLTPYEVATRLAYKITDSMPDQSLLTAANDGSIMTPLGLQQQVQRLMKTPRGKTKIINSLLRWSLTDNASDVSSLPAELLSGVQLNGLQAAMTNEARAFIDYTIFTANGSLKDLLTSKLSFASHNGLANIYGHTPMTTTTGPVPMTERRQGLLMRAPFLTWFTSKTNIILRGVNFQKRVLCNEIPAPTVDIADDRDGHILTEDELLSVTNRTAVAYQTESPLCMSCHRVINPVGFAFENFDSLGKIRTQEKIFDKSNIFVRNLPVHTSTSVPMPTGADLNVADAYDMVTGLAQSPEVAACATRNMYRYFYEKKETKADDCQLEDSFELVKDENKSLLQAIEKIFTAESIYYKEL